MSQTVYVAQAGNEIKIGVSKDPESRVKQLNTANASEVELLYELRSLENRGRTAKEWESMLHDHLAEYNLSGEWFEIEALEKLWEFIDAYETDVELTERQSNALGVALTLQDNLPSGLCQRERGEITNFMPESEILRTIVDEYDLPHGACDACAHLAYYHLSENNDECQRCGTPKQ